MRYTESSGRHTLAEHVFYVKPKNYSKQDFPLSSSYWILNKIL